MTVLDQYISYSWWRNEAWKGHPHKSAVRRAIAHDRGRNRLRILALVYIKGDPVYREIPREMWAAEFDIP